jgi:hypothetical protein
MIVTYYALGTLAVALAVWCLLKAFDAARSAARAAIPRALATTALVTVALGVGAVGAYCLVTAGRLLAYRLLGAS